MKQLHVWMTKEEIVPERLEGAVAVVMDVLLATTTMVTMVERGAGRVFPVASMEEARRLRQQLDSPRLLTGGEQDGVKVAEFDYGPFPDEFTPEVVADKDIIFLTTNGTRAVRAAQSAGQLLLGCLRNAPIVSDYLKDCPYDDVYLICAGSRGRFSYEDFMCAGEIISRLDLTNVKLNDAARFARDLGRQERVVERLARGRVGEFFVHHQMHHVLEFVGDVGASTTLVEVRNGQLQKMEEAR